MSVTQSGVLRVAMAVGAVAYLVLTTGYALQQPWATRTWPWDVGPLSYIFMASMLAAIGVAAAWIAYSGRLVRCRPGF